MRRRRETTDRRRLKKSLSERRDAAALDEINRRGRSLAADDALRDAASSPSITPRDVHKHTTRTLRRSTRREKVP